MPTLARFPLPLVGLRGVRGLLAAINSSGVLKPGTAVVGCGGVVGLSVFVLADCVW